MTREQIIEKFRANDLDFIIRFVIDNNPEDVKSNLIRKGDRISSNYSLVELYEAVKKRLDAGKKQEVKEILSVNYSDASEQEYTNGFREFVEVRSKEIQEASGRPPLRSMDWGSLALIVGAALTGVGAIATGGSSTGPAATDDDDDDKKNEDKKILGIDPVLFWSLSGLLVVVGVVVLLKKTR